MAGTDLQQVILSGLDTSYDAIVTSLTTTLVDTTMEDFQAHPLAFESRLHSQNQVDELTPSVNIAARTSQGHGRGFSPTSSNRGRNSTNCGRGTGRTTTRTGPRSNAGLVNCAVARTTRLGHFGIDLTGNTFLMVNTYPLMLLRLPLHNLLTRIGIQIAVPPIM